MKSTKNPFAQPNKIRFGVLTSTLLTIAGASGPFSSVLAQENGDVLTEIQVTGSRIMRRDFEANSPIQTVDETFFDESSLTGVEAMLNRLPQFNPGITQSSTSIPTGDQFNTIGATGTRTVGASTLSLRGLGANRNLVLINGRRAIPVNASGAVDINMIPASAIQRVETITGGASSVYGADAMAGVVNFILKDNYEGFELNGQFSQTERGDGENQQISGLMGANVDGGRGNVMLGWDFSKRGEIRNVDVDFFLDGLIDPSMEGTAPGASITRTGYVVDTANSPTSAAVNQIFGTALGTVSNIGTFHLNPDANKTLFRTTSDGSFRYNGPFLNEEGLPLRKIETDGSLSENTLESLTSIPLERISFFFDGNYDITDNISAFANATYARNKNRTVFRYSPAIGPWASPIPHGNEIYADSLEEDGSTAGPYLPGGLYGLDCPAMGGCTNSQVFPVPPELAALLDSRADPNAPWRVSHITDWAGPRRTQNRVQSYQVTAGFEGSLPYKDWTWEAFASIGNTDVITELDGTASLQRLRAVLTSPNYGRGFEITGNTDTSFGRGFGGGRATCESGLPIVEDFTTSADCKDAATITSLNFTTEMEQKIVEVNLQGELLSLPAGEVRTAMGYQYRENSFAFEAAQLQSQGSFLDQGVGLFPTSNSRGKTSNSDVYLELLVPLLRDIPGIQELNLETGYRYSDNDPSPSVDTYKILGDWKVNDWIRFRGGLQVANRAPNIGELYQARTQAFTTTATGDFCSEANPGNSLSANPDLNPNAAQVRAICEELMGTTGALTYYDPGNDQPDNLVSFVFFNAVGNPDLKNERAETITIGGVFQPIEGMTISVDWYDIEISDLISVESPEAVGRLCFDTASNPGLDPSFNPCQRLVRNPVTGASGPTDVAYSNQAALDTQGLDVQFDYKYPIGNGVAGLNVQYNYIDRYATRITKESDWVDFKGSLGPNNLVGIDGGAFDYRAFTTFTYSHDSGLNASLRWRYLPPVRNESIPAGFLGSDEFFIDDTHDYSIFDLAMSYRFSLFGEESTVLRFGIDNLLDTQPEITSQDTNPDRPNSGAGQTNAGFYDVLGRRYFVGFTASF